MTSPERCPTCGQPLPSERAPRRRLRVPWWLLLTVLAVVVALDVAIKVRWSR